MKFKLIILIVSFLFLSSCGFKVSNLETNYNISAINTSGDQRINYKLKNAILKSSIKDNVNLIEIELNSQKSKNIKEKNIRNETTKYTLNIKTDVKYSFLDNRKSGKFTIVKNGDYNVSSKYSDTLNNEKNLTKTLIDNLAEEILESLSLRIK
jgi:hypothetical protein